MNIAIIGFGGMGHYHSTMISEYGGFTLTKVYDTNPERGRLAQSEGFVAVGSAEEIFADKSIAAVIIATPNDSHFYYAAECIRHGKHVLLEKPAVLTSAEFEKLMALADRAEVVLTVHQNRRYDGDFLTARKIISEGLVGKPYHLESAVMGANGIPGSWRRLKSQGGGMVYDWGVHLIDQALVFFGEPFAIEAKCFSPLGCEVDEGFFAEFLYPDFVYRIIVDTNAYLSKPRWYMLGAAGSARIESWNEPAVIARAGKLESRPEGIVAGNGYTRTMAARSAGSVDYSEMPILQPAKNIIYENFRACIEDGAEAEIKNVEVLACLRAIEAVFESADTGKAVLFK